MTIPSFLFANKNNGNLEESFYVGKSFHKHRQTWQLNSLFFLLALGRGNVWDVRKQTGKFIFSLSTTKNTLEVFLEVWWCIPEWDGKSNNQEFYTYSKYQAWNLDNLFALRDTVEAFAKCQNLFRTFQSLWGFFVETRRGARAFSPPSLLTSCQE